MSSSRPTSASRKARSMPRLRRCAIPSTIMYDFNLPDVAEVWRRGSVIASWLLDLTASALVEDPQLAKFAGRVSDSGEGRWTIKASIDEGVPTSGADDLAVRALQLARPRPTLPTSCCRRCATNSADTWRKRQGSRALLILNSPGAPFWPSFGQGGAVRYF